MALGQLGRIGDGLRACDDLERAVERAGAVGARFPAIAMNVRAWLLRGAERLAEADELNAAALERNAAPDGTGPAGVAVAEGYWVALLDLADGRLVADDPAGAERLLLERMGALDDWDGTMAWHQRHRLGLLRSRLAIAAGDATRGAELAAIVAADATDRGSAALRRARPRLVPTRRRRRRRRRRGRHDRRAARLRRPRRVAPRRRARPPLWRVRLGAPRRRLARPGHRQRGPSHADRDHEDRPPQRWRRPAGVRSPGRPLRAGRRRRGGARTGRGGPCRGATPPARPDRARETAPPPDRRWRRARPRPPPRGTRPARRTIRPGPASRRTRCRGRPAEPAQFVFDDALDRVVVVGGVGADGDGSPRPRHPGRLGEAGGRIGEVVERERRQHDVGARCPHRQVRGVADERRGAPP